VDVLPLDPVQPEGQGERDELFVGLAGATQRLVDPGERVAADAVSGEVELVDGGL
jgi:hypothetical protein